MHPDSNWDFIIKSNALNHSSSATSYILYLKNTIITFYLLLFMNLQFIFEIWNFQIKNSLNLNLIKNSDIY